ncbi:cupin domain-containing protein [Mesorhizobium sp. M0676]|uniref:cupin domain-containing protein n=1 Tax=unclassified Mesorhizobium TaxID=325217 RepID=UPI00333DAEB6
MKARQIGAIILIAGSGVVFNATWAQQTKQMPGIKRTDLQRHDLSIPGQEAIQTRVDFAPGAAFPGHRHPGEEIVYVLAGSIEYEVEGQRPQIINTGGVPFIPAMVPHAAKNVGTVNAAGVGTYVVEKGKPLVELVK